MHAKTTSGSPGLSLFEAMTAVTIKRMSVTKAVPRTNTNTVLKVMIVQPKEILHKDRTRTHKKTNAQGNVLVQICVGARTRLHTSLHKGVAQGTHKACTRLAQGKGARARNTRTHKATHKANKTLHKALHKVFDAINFF